MSSESFPENHKKTERKNLENPENNDVHVFQKVDTLKPSINPPEKILSTSELDAARMQEVQAMGTFERDVLKGAIVADVQKNITDITHFVKNSSHSLSSAGKGAMFGALTYLSLHLSQMLLNAGKYSWYAVKKVGEITKNILHYLSFKKIKKADPVLSPEYFTYADDIKKLIGGIVPFSVGGAVGGMATGTDIFGKGKELISGLFSSSDTASALSSEPSSIELPVRFSAEKEALLQKLPPMESSLSHFEPLRRVIIAGESIKGFSSPYEAFNKKRAGDSNGQYIGLQKMPLSEVIRRQELPEDNKDRIFAAGAYQICPFQGKSLLRLAAEKLNIPLQTPFSQKIQDRIWAEYYLPYEARGAWLYLKGNKNATLENAAKIVALRWACFSSPSGKGNYDGIAGNQATVPYSFLLQALKQTRNTILQK